MSVCAGSLVAPGLISLPAVRKCLWLTVSQSPLHFSGGSGRLLLVAALTHQTMLTSFVGTRRSVFARALLRLVDTLMLSVWGRSSFSSRLGGGLPDPPLARPSPSQGSLGLGSRIV